MNWAWDDVWTYGDQIIQFETFGSETQKIDIGLKMSWRGLAWGGSRSGYRSCSQWSSLGWPSSRSSSTRRCLGKRPHEPTHGGTWDEVRVMWIELAKKEPRGSSYSLWLRWSDDWAWEVHGKMIVSDDRTWDEWTWEGTWSETELYTLSRFTAKGIDNKHWTMSGRRWMLPRSMIFM